MNKINLISNEDNSVTLYVNNIPWITRSAINKETKEVFFEKHLGENIEVNKMFVIPVANIDDVISDIKAQIELNISLIELNIK